MRISKHGVLLSKHKLLGCFMTFSHLCLDIVLHLIHHGSPLKRTLKLKNTPGLIRHNLVMTYPQ